MTKPNKLHQESDQVCVGQSSGPPDFSYVRGAGLNRKRRRKSTNVVAIPNSHTKAKNADVVTYRMSTGFEAVMGYLHMTENLERLESLISWCIQKVEG